MRYKQNPTERQDEIDSPIVRMLIKQAREERKLSQKTLGNIVGKGCCGGSYFSNIESGKTTITEEVLKRTAHALKKPYDWFFDKNNIHASNNHEICKKCVYAKMHAENGNRFFFCDYASRTGKTRTATLLAMGEEIEPLYVDGCKLFKERTKKDGGKITVRKG